MRNILDKHIENLEKEEYIITQEMFDTVTKKIQPLTIHNPRMQKIMSNLNKNLVGRKIEKGENITKVILNSIR